MGLKGRERDEYGRLYPIMGTKLTKAVNIKLSEEDHKELMEYCKKNNTSAAEIGRELLLTEMERVRNQDASPVEGEEVVIRVTNESKRLDTLHRMCEAAKRTPEELCTDIVMSFIDEP